MTIPGFTSDKDEFGDLGSPGILQGWVDAEESRKVDGSAKDSYTNDRTNRKV